MSGYTQYTQEDVRKIIEGSDELNRKKREIGRVLSMVAGLIGEEADKMGGHFHGCAIGLRGDREHQLVVFRSLPSGVRMELRRLSLSNGTHGSTVYTAVCQHLHNSADGLPVDLVQPLHETLPYFLTNLRLTFPTLSEKLTFFIKAAEHEKETA